MSPPDARLLWRCGWCRRVQILGERHRSLIWGSLCTDCAIEEGTHVT